MQEIADWLKTLGMSEYEQRFAENGIDVSALRHLTDQDLKDIGVLLGHRRKKRVGSAISACRLDSERMSATEITDASGQSATFGSLFNHLVGACEQRGRNVEAK
jgi:hypothetical protein